MKIMRLTLDNQDSCSPAPESHWGTVTVQPPYGGGRDEGTDMFRGRRSPSGLLAIVVSTAIEPPYVCGAATCSLRWQTASKSGHAARGQPRRDEYSGKKGKNPLLGVVCLLTIGVLIRVRLFYCPQNSVTVEKVVPVNPLTSLMMLRRSAFRVEDEEHLSVDGL
jgi:hypothetical protein